MGNERDNFTTDPRSVDRWLEALPIAHVGETARQLYLALRIANKQENIPVKHHFHLLEGIAEPLSFILPELHRHYAGKPLPLSQKRRKVADLYTQLLRQAIQGYQHVIAHSIELNRFGWKKVVTTSVHRIFAFSSLMLFNYRQLYMPYQKGMWQQLYWMYQLIEKYDLLNTKILGVGEHASKTTITSEFKKLLLFSLLSPNLFRKDELAEVLANLDIWTQYVSILTLPISSDENQTYAFTLDTDLPPGLFAKSSNLNDNPMIDVRYLDISDLLVYINKLLASSNTGLDQIRISRHSNASSRTLLLLLNNWGRPASRDGQRRSIQGRAEVAIGISAIHFVISDGRYDMTPVTPVQSVQDLQNQFTIADTTLTPQGGAGFLGFTAELDKKHDIWESAYFVPDAPPPSWTESMRMKVYSYLNARVLNISKGGFCIALPQDGVEHIQTNELIAIRGKNGQWQLGEIRWMVCPTNGPIRAGIRKLSSKIVPAQLYMRADKKPAQPIKCLIGEHDEGKQIFLPSLPTSLEGRALSIEINKDIQKISLQEQSYQTPISSGYFVNISLPQRNEPDNQTGDTYESIWASL